MVAQCGCLCGSRGDGSRIDGVLGTPRARAEFDAGGGEHGVVGATTSGKQQVGERRVELQTQ
eukprot:6713045-Prorocentrum_lima.AAC.1